MPNLHTPEAAAWLLQAFISAFLAILFLQSGIDKVVDRRGNLEWLTGHFAKSPLARAELEAWFSRRWGMSFEGQTVWNQDKFKKTLYYGRVSGLLPEPWIFPDLLGPGS